MHEKIIELETKFAFQEDLLTDLNSAVAQQQRQIGELIRELAMIKLQMAVLIEGEMKQALGGHDEHEVPPHY
ncbi:MAG: SlyX family protein [Gammaproteobacteria bacterium]|nr:SlyX family protein [Gammaproteobacteria bacterium]